MKTKKILEDLPGHADEVGKLFIGIKRGAAVTASNSLCRMSLLNAQERFSWNIGHCGKYLNPFTAKCSLRKISTKFADFIL